MAVSSVARAGDCLCVRQVHSSRTGSQAASMEAKDKIDVFVSMLDVFVCYENERDNLSYYFD
jgi:hypothetical protein